MKLLTAMALGLLFTVFACGIIATLVGIFGFASKFGITGIATTCLCIMFVVFTTVVYVDGRK